MNKFIKKKYIRSSQELCYIEYFQEAQRQFSRTITCRWKTMTTQVLLQHVGNKAKGRISKRVFQEHKARQIFQKRNISYPLIRTLTCVYQGVRNNRFSDNLACFVFLKHPF